MKYFLQNEKRIEFEKQRVLLLKRKMKYLFSPSCNNNGTTSIISIKSRIIVLPTSSITILRQNAGSFSIRIGRPLPSITYHKHKRQT